MSFTKKLINVTIQLGQGSFGESGYDQVELTGLRVSANITKGADPSFDAAELRVYGLTPALLNKVSTLGKSAYFDRVNNVIVKAGDAAGVAIVYQGNIRDAFQVTEGSDMALNIVSNVGLVSNTKPVPPSSYPGRVDVATVMANLAAQMTPPVAFQNNGVSSILSSPYFPGTALDQLRAAKAAAIPPFESTIDNGVLVIWPKGSARDGLIPTIGPMTGLVGYPRFSGTGFVALTTIYQPGLRLGGDFMLVTSLQPAPGKYRTNSLSYDLESETPDGKWFANMTAYRPEALQQ